MKSSSGKYYLGLDHLRALAAFMVFSWHFVQTGVENSYYPSLIPFSLINEGHTGVALFMALSGYLFAKLLDGKKIKYLPFFWNRFIRLVPLLVFVIILAGIQSYWRGNAVSEYLIRIRDGFIEPTLPNGGWSITVEFHFYLLLPLLLFVSRKSKYSLPGIVCLAILLRLFLQRETGDIQWYAYWTIIGRIDQFLLGMIAYQMREHIAGRHLLAIGTFAAFSAFYWAFDKAGGFWENPSYPSNRLVWVYLPTFEGLAYALIIAWYDNSFQHSTGRVSRFIAQIGAYSYSIYLLHIFICRKMFDFMSENLMPPQSGFYVLLCFSGLGFLLMVPIGYLSFRFIESPFLKLRKSYLIEAQPEVVPEKVQAPVSEAMSA